jgi:methanol--5-hydroxybenzimidazolylcobamide Co-methyltransferase
MAAFTSLAIPDPDDLIFGTCPRPLTLRSGLRIGAGQVHPEVNFTLPAMMITADTMDDVAAQYHQMVTGVCDRAVELSASGLVVEFEMLPDMTLNPEWGIRVVELLRTELDRYAEKGLVSGLRVTPNDIREFSRPPILREGKLWEDMLRSFEGSALAGADMLAVESTGGKELHDGVMLNADLPGIVFALGVLGCRDMEFLWTEIVEICRRTGATPSGDSACGFANTAMVLADQRHIPRVLAALIRALTIPRALVAFERGAVGPSKDCAYEGPFLKAITGYPISLEGAEAAVAHLSPIGNIAKATPDLWSNESVANSKLLGGMAPTVSAEQLVYATRLMNVATARHDGSAATLRDLFVASDAGTDPQAYLLRPDVVVELSREVVAETSPYLRTRRVGLAALAALRRGVGQGDFILSRPETRWLDRLSRAMDEIPDDEDELIAAVAPTVDPTKVRLDQYGLTGVLSGS